MLRKKSAVKSIEASIAQPTNVDGSGKKILKPSYFISGPLIGHFQDNPIYDFVMDDHGIRRNYEGLAKGISKLKPGSIIISPGLVYAPV